MTSQAQEACQASGCVSDLMTPSPITAGRDTSVSEVLQLMTERRIRHVPVCDDESLLLGIVSQRDILALSSGQGSLDHLPIGEVMHPSVDIVTPECCVGAAARHMLRTKRSSLPVVDDKGCLVGILTEADFVRFVLRGWPACTCDGVHEGG
jgi:CBS domain-containing protein